MKSSPPDLTYLIAEIDLDAIVHNCNLLRSLAPKTCKLCVSVKADAYGHDIGVVLPALQKAHADMLATASLQEARELRELGWSGSTLVFGSEFSIHRDDHQKHIAKWIIDNDIRITVTRRQDAKVLAAAAETLNRQASVHVMLDTGMSRMGLHEDDLLDLIGQLRQMPAIDLEGLYTHFATAEGGDPKFVYVQLERFNAFLDRLKTAGIDIPLIHAANSGAAIDYPEAHFTMIRPGNSCYGYNCRPNMHHEYDLRPAMRIISYLTLVKKIPAGNTVGYSCTYEAKRDIVIGLVPIGYADGFDRRLSNIGKMTIAGRLVDVIGRVSMDQTIVDLTGLADAGITVAPGEKVIIVDNNSDAPNSVEGIAKAIKSSRNDVTCGFRKRITRIGRQCIIRRCRR